PGGEGGAGRPRGDGSRRGGANGPGGPGGQGGGRPAGPRPAGAPHPAVVYVPTDSGLARPQRVLAGLTDGSYVEILRGLDEGATVITGITVPGGEGPRTAPSGANNPFAPQRPQPRSR